MRSPTPDDLEPLGELLLAAYRGTIDDEGETIVEAIAEVRTFLDGGSGGPALLECSRILLDGDRPVGACLVSLWERKTAPLVAQIATHPEWQGRGRAARLLRSSLEGLAAAGHVEVWAVITEGNETSERLFERAGFVREKRAPSPDGDEEGRS